MALVIFQTNWIVAGAVSFGYTVTAIKGAYYFIFQLTVLIGFALILYTLARRYLVSTNTNDQLKCFYAGLSLSPIIIISLFVMTMMQADYQYTGAILLPFASTFFLLLVVMTEKNNDLISIQGCLLYTSPSPRDQRGSRMPSSA